MKLLKYKFGLILKLIIFTLFSILVRGYQYGSGNQVHYFNFAFHKFYPNLFQGDYLFKIHDIPYTIFVDFLNVLLKTFGENAFIFFVVYFVFLFFFYWSIYSISNFLFQNKKISGLILLLFIFPIPIGGSTIYTVEKALTPKLVAETLLLLSIYFLLAKKFIISALVAGFGFLFHPITLIAYGPIVLLNNLFESKESRESWKKVLLIIGVFLIVSSPILIKFVLNGQGGGIFLDYEWMKIIKDRLPYLFIEEWSLINFLVIATISLFFIFYKFVFKHKLNSVVKSIVFVSLIIFAISFISSFTGFRLGLQLQLARNLYLFVVIFLVFGAGSFLSFLSETNLKRVAVLFVVLPVILSFPKRGEFGIFWINPIEDYEQVALWAKENTSTESVFVVPLDEYGFRFWSKRAVFVEQKEGGDSLYDRNFAIEWNKRQELINDKEFTNELVEKLKTEYEVSYIVSSKEQNNLNEVYRYKKYYVYKI